MPTIYSKRELLPLLYVPKTAMRGSDIYLCNPISRNLSTNVMTFLKFSKRQPCDLFPEFIFVLVFLNLEEQKEIKKKNTINIFLQINKFINYFM